MATPGLAQVLHTEETHLRGGAVAKEFAEYDGFFRNADGQLSADSADKRKVCGGGPATGWHSSAGPPQPLIRDAVPPCVCVCVWHRTTI
jgi:hypothetical protein